MRKLCMILSLTLFLQALTISSHAAALEPANHSAKAKSELIIEFGTDFSYAVPNDALAMSGIYGGVGALTKTGEGLLALSGANTYTGGTKLLSGEIYIANNEALGSGAVAMSGATTLSLQEGITTRNDINLADKATGSINVAAGTGTVSGIITGANSKLSKKGPGMLTLSGANTYSGGTALSEGEIFVGNSGARTGAAVVEGSTGGLGTGPIEMSNGTVLSLDRGITTINAIYIEPAAKGSIHVADGKSTLSGGISGENSVLVKTGDGVLLLAGVNTYSGGTHLTEGEICVGNSAVRIRGKIAEAPNGGLGTGAFDMDHDTTLALESGTIATNAIHLGLSATDNINVAEGIGTLSGIITGENSVLVKTGAGALALSGINTYNGGTTLSEGKLVVANNLALGTGVLTIGDKTLLGTTLAVDEAVREVSLSDSITLSNDIEFVADVFGTIEVPSGTGEVSGVISGVDSHLVKTGDGKLILSGVNTYSGDTLCTQGILSVSTESNLGAAGGDLYFHGGILQTTADMSLTGEVHCTSSAKLDVASDVLTLLGTVVGSNSVDKTGTGVLVLSGENTYEARTTLSEGEIVVGNNAGLGTGKVKMSAGTTLSLGSGITAGNEIDIENSETVNIKVAEGTGILSGKIDGSNSFFTKTGGGVLSLSRRNFYTGGTILSAGELFVGDNDALGTGPVSINPETILLGATVTQPVTTLSIGSDIILRNDVSFAAGVAIPIKVAEGTGTLSGTISGTNSVLSKVGAGVLSLSGVNTYSGGTTLSAGEILVGNNAALGTGAVSISTGATLSLDSNIDAGNTINLTSSETGTVNVSTGTGTLSGIISGDNSILSKIGSGTLALSASNTYSGGTTLLDGILSVGQDNNLGDVLADLTFNGGMLQATGAFSSARGTILTGAGMIDVIGDSLTMTGIVSGEGSLTKRGPGFLSLSGVNTYSGGTTLSSGEIVVGHSEALGTGSVSMSDQTRLSLNDSITMSNDINLSVARTDTINVATGTGALTGIISGINSILEKTGDGVLSLSGVNAYSGGTVLAEGSILVGNNAALGTGSLTMFNGTTLSLGRSITVDTAINVSAGSLGVNVAAGTGTLSGLITGIHANLTKTGAGILILSQNNAYTGGTTLSEGEIVLSNSGGLGAREITMANGTILSLDSGITAANDISFMNSAVGHINVSAGTGSLVGLISGTNGGLYKTGSGTLVLFRANTYSGETTLVKGEIVLSNNDALGTGGVFMSNETILSLDSDITASNAINLASSGTGTLNLAEGTGSLSGVISGEDSMLVKTGAGTITLSGVNTYSGGTTISQGGLFVGNNEALGSGSLGISGGAALSLDSDIIIGNAINLPDGARSTINVASGRGTLSGVIAGIQSEITKPGAGTLILSGANTYSGGTTLSAGELFVGNNAALGTGPVSMADQTNLSLDRGILVNNDINLTELTTGFINVAEGTGTLSGTISGTNSILSKVGAGILVLSGVNTYSGGTIISEGELFVGNNAALAAEKLFVGNSAVLGTGAIVIADEATLSLGSSITVSNVINIHDSATGFINVAEGIGTLSGNISGENSSIDKVGDGVLALSGVNTYSGRTQISAGEILISNNAALGRSVLSIDEEASLVLDNGVTVSNDIMLSSNGTCNINIVGGTGTLSGTISGENSILSKIGDGALILTGTNTYSGSTFIQGGKVIISNANNLGTGNLLLSGGLLETLENVTLTADLLLFGQNEIEVLSGTLSLLGLVTGSEIKKTGMGTLSFAGINTYTGLSIIEAGILELSGNGTLGLDQGLLINGGSLVLAMDAGTKIISTLNGGGFGINLNNNILEVGEGSFAGAISGTGGGLSKTSDGALMLSGTNTFTGDLTINQGELQISTADNLGMGNVVLNGGTLSFLRLMTIDHAISVDAFSQIETESDANIIVTGVISGTSDLAKLGEGKLTLMGDSPLFMGTTTVEAGALHVRGVLGGPVIVFSPSILGGTGSVGTVRNSGKVIPGASIGTLSITGDYAQDPDASLVIEIEDDPFSSDLLEITGTANLDGTLTLNPMPGIYEPGMVFTFLKASTVNGTFTELIESHALDFELNYLADAVSLTVRLPQVVLPIPISGLNGNAKSVANYLFSCEDSTFSAELDPIIRTLVKVTPDNFPAALRQLGPQQFGSLALANLQTSARVGLSMNQTRDVYETYYLTSGDPSGNETTFAPDQSIWVNPIGYYYKHNEVEEQLPFNSRTYGFTAGYRTRFNQLVVSAGTGYTFSNLNWVQNNGGAHIQSVYLSPSIGYIGEYGYAGFVLLGSRSFYDVDRKIDFSTFRAEAHNNHKSYDLLAGLRGSLKLQCLKNSPNNFFLLPTINLDYLNIFESGYQEAQAGAIDLSVKNMHSAFFRPEVTVKLLKEWTTPCICSSPSIYIGWLRNIPLTEGSYTSRFYKQAVCEKDFTVKSYDRATDQLVVGAEVLVMYKARSSLKLGYEANLGNKYSIHEGKLNFNWAF